METLPNSLLLEILSRLNDSADVARCRLASKALNTVSPDLRSINLLCSSEWYTKSRVSNSSTSQHTKLTAIFLNLISNLRIVESVRIELAESSGFIYRSPDLNAGDDFYVTDAGFAEEWLPRVSRCLKSLSLSGALIYYCSRPQLDLLLLISVYCYNLVNLKLKRVPLSIIVLNPMPMLTSLTLELIIFHDQHLDELNKCLPNLQVLNLVHVSGLKDPKIHLRNLKTCRWVLSDNPLSLTLITPNLAKLTIDCSYRHAIRPKAAVHLEAPILSHFQLSLSYFTLALTVKTFENLTTFWLDSLFIASLLSEFPITKTLENLTLGSNNVAPRDTTASKLTLLNVFTVFPNVSSLCIRSRVWSELEVGLNGSNTQGLENFDGGKGLKTVCVYLVLVDPSLTFSCVACLLDHCVDLLEVRLLFRVDVSASKVCDFRFKCIEHWPGLKWRWGIWSEGMKDSWDI